jgi:hypothetical protein
MFTPVLGSTSCHMNRPAQVQPTPLGLGSTHQDIAHRRWHRGLPVWHRRRQRRHQHGHPRHVLLATIPRPHRRPSRDRGWRPLARRYGRGTRMRQEYARCTHGACVNVYFPRLHPLTRLCECSWPLKSPRFHGVRRHDPGRLVCWRASARHCFCIPILRPISTRRPDGGGRDDAVPDHPTCVSWSWRVRWRTLLSPQSPCQSVLTPGHSADVHREHDGERGGGTRYDVTRRVIVPRRVPGKAARV